MASILRSEFIVAIIAGICAIYFARSDIKSTNPLIRLVIWSIPVCVFFSSIWIWLYRGMDLPQVIACSFFAEAPSCTLNHKIVPALSKTEIQSSDPSALPLVEDADPGSAKKYSPVGPYKTGDQRRVPDNENPAWIPCLSASPKEQVVGCTSYIEKASNRFSRQKAYFNRGNAYRKLNEAGKAFADYTTSISIVPDDADAYLNRGNVLMDVGKTQEALADFNKAIQIKPELALALSARGALLHRMGQDERSVIDLTAAVQADPTDPEPALQLGDVYYDLHRFPEAITAYDRSIRNDDRNANAYYNRSLARRAVGDIAGADADMTKSQSVERGK